MSHLLVDTSACAGDGICVSVCPVGIITLDTNTKRPIAAEDAPQRCIHCGHCVAACPHAALSLPDMPAHQCQNISEHWNLSPLQLDRLLKSRRSTRVFNKEPVNRDIFEKILETARYAPSGINLQPVRWLIIHNDAAVKKIAEATIDWMRNLIQQASPLADVLHMRASVSAWDMGNDRICRNAPHLVIAYALKNDQTAPAAATIALTYFELTAAAYNLGTCWAGYAHMALNASPSAFKLLDISSRCSCYGVMMTGYPRVSYARIPGRNPARIKWG